MEDSTDPTSGESVDLEVQKECLELFSSTDFIMEPIIFETITKYFMKGKIIMLFESFSSII